jgi:hypothetical protein
VCWHRRQRGALLQRGSPLVAGREGVRVARQGRRDVDLWHRHRPVARGVAGAVAAPSGVSDLREVTNRSVDNVDMTTNLDTLRDAYAVAVFEGDAERINLLENEIAAIERDAAMKAAAERGAILAEQRRIADAEAQAKEVARREVAAARRELRKLTPALDKAAKAYAEAVVRSAGAYARANGGDFKSDVLVGILRECIRSVEPRDIFEQRAVRSITAAAGSDGFRHPATYGTFFEYLTSLAEV